MYAEDHVYAAGPAVPIARNYGRRRTEEIAMANLLRGLVATSKRQKGDVEETTSDSVSTPLKIRENSTSQNS